MQHIGEVGIFVRIAHGADVDQVQQVAHSAELRDIQNALHKPVQHTNQIATDRKQTHREKRTSQCTGTSTHSSVTLRLPPEVSTTVFFCLKMKSTVGKRR